MSEACHRCVRLNSMVEDIDPHIIYKTESWASTDITNAELELIGYVKFRGDRIGRRGGGFISYVNEYIQAYEITCERKADYDEAVCCKIVSGNNFCISLSKSKHKRRG